MSVEFSEALLVEAAGWDVVKRARAYLTQGHVLSSYWEPPLLRGVVQCEGGSIRAAMVIKGNEIENLCNCREARSWGKMCAHGVAVGLHWLQAQKPATSPAPARSSVHKTPAIAPVRKASGLLREMAGEPAELFIILPPNFDQALARGKVMLVFEAQWAGGRCPLNALPRGRAYAFTPADQAIIEHIEALANGETPALLQLEVKALAALLPLLAEHGNVTIGKATPITVTKKPLELKLRATLEPNGDIVLALNMPPAALIRIESWAWQKPTLQPLGLPALAGDLFQAPMRVPRSQVPQFLSQHWPPMQANGRVESNFTLDDFSFEPQAPRFLLALRGGLAILNAQLQCAYGPRIMTVGVTTANESVWLPDPDVATRYSTRDANAERAALGRLMRSGFSAKSAS